MPGMGPAPKPADHRRRRNATLATTLLPAEGRQGPAPRWPLTEPATPEERKLWRELWRSPQAVAWEDLGWTRMVARYCRHAIDAERPLAKTTVLSEVRQMEDRLGLTPMSMLRLRWQVAGDEVGEVREQKQSQGAANLRRLKAVDRDAVERS